MCSDDDDSRISWKGNKKHSRAFPNKFLCAGAALREKSGVQVRFLLGPAGSGKTFRCLREIRDALRKDAATGAPELILLAPKQATFQLERQLLDFERWGERAREPEAISFDGSPGVSPHQLQGYTRLRVLSFERLARFVFERSGVAPSRPLSDEGRVMVLRALLLRHERELKLFRASAHRPGFAQELDGLFNEFRRHQLTPSRLRSLARRPGLASGLREKLQDLALLNDAYMDWLSGHELEDGNGLPDAAAAVLRSGLKTKNLKLKIQSLWLDGFAGMTPQELDLLAAILPFCERATLTFCLAPAFLQKSGNSWLSPWSAVGKTYQECRTRVENLPDCEVRVEEVKRAPDSSRFTGSPALRFLEANWPQPRSANSGKFEIRNSKSEITLVSCQTPEAEAVFAAREILKFVRAGNRFRDCAVLVRSLDNYHKPLARTFRRYGVPFFLDRRESVSHHPLAELTRGALRTVAFDWRQEDWFAALKAGFAPVDEGEIDRLENAALEFGWRGEGWRKPLPDEGAEQLREKILPPFENFARRLARFKDSPTGGQLAEALRSLWDELDVEGALERWNLAGSEQSATRNSDKSRARDENRCPQPAIHLTVWEQMNLWLENLALAFPRETLSLRDWLPILEAGLSNLTVGVIPPVLDEVLVGAVDRARNPDLKLALVLGVNESVFPAPPAVSTILSDADRDELGYTVALGPDLRERLAREQYYSYIACTRARERFVMTFARRDTDGKMLNPSPFIAHLRWIFPGMEIEEFNGEIPLVEVEHAIELVRPFVEIQMGAPLPAMRGEGGRLVRSSFSEGGRPGEGWLELLGTPALKALAGDLRPLREPDPSERLSSALAEKLFGPMLRSSASQLEEFAACPFRFFVHSGLQAKERKIFKLDARERGSFQHEVLKKFHEDLTREGKRWRDITPEEARERVGKIAGELAAGYRGGLLRDTAQSEFEALAMAGSLQDFVEVVVSWMRGQYEFDPAAAELEFGGGKSAPAWVIDLGGGRKLALGGRIDRIDLCPQADGSAWCVVMDYKSGGKKPDAVLMEHGVQLQLLAYLNALRHWPEPQTLSKAARLVPAGVFFVNLRGQYESGDTRAEVLESAAAARKRAYRHVGRFDASALSWLDSAKAADQFNYRFNRDGTLRKGLAEALPHAEFEALLDHVEVQLREMGRAIFSGEAGVAPYRKGGGTPCDFCDYRAVCRMDPCTHRYRVLRAAKEAAV